MQSRLSDAAEAWDRTKDTASISALEAFVRRFGDTYYGDLAKGRLVELKQAEAAKKKADDEVRGKAEAEQQRVAMLQKEREKKREEVKNKADDPFAALFKKWEEERAEEAKRKAEEEAARRDAALSVKPGSGQSFRDCPDCPEMVVVPAGSFMMGSPPSERDRYVNEGPQHKVKIARSFAVGKYEVTFAEWDACLRAGTCKHIPDDARWGRGNRPVINVSWDDITTEYLPWLSRKTGKTYRLLTEAEWEYTARAGTTTPFWWGSSIPVGHANYDGILAQTSPVDAFASNPWGLFHVHGNVSAWVEDCWNPSYQGSPADASARKTEDCSRRVLRGGSWYNHQNLLRAAFRAAYLTVSRDRFIGFRIARTLD